MRYVRGHRRPYGQHHLTEGPWHRAISLTTTACGAGVATLPQRADLERDTWPEGRRCAACVKALAT